MSEKANEMIAELRALTISQRDEAITTLKRYHLATGERLQFGTTFEAADFFGGVLRGEDTASRTMGKQLQIFPSRHPAGGLMYFGYRIGDDEFVWAFGFPRNS